MKKIIVCCMALIMLMGCLSVSAASSSPEQDDVISEISATDSDGQPVEIDFDRLIDELDSLVPDNEDDRVIAQYDLDIEEGASYPVDVNVNIAGIKKDAEVYILALDSEGKVTKIEVQVVSDGKVSFVLDKPYATVAFVTDKKTPTGTSDKTGDSSMAVAALMVASAACVVVAKTKMSLTNNEK